MKKGNKAVPDPDLRAEYDFASMTGGVRGKYAERYKAGVNLVLLEPEVAEAFPTAAAVNEALRTAMRGAKTSARKAGPPAKRVRREQAIDPLG
jgi:hypothetical protein